MATNFYDKWEPGETYSFTPIVSSPLPTEYRRCKLQGVNLYETALKLAGSDLYAQWRIIFPKLPAGTVDNPERQKWYHFTSMAGETIVLAEAWIDGSSVVVTDFVNASIDLTETSTTQIQKIRDVLNQMKVKFEIRF